MTLEDLGYNASLEQYRIDNHLDELNVGRVITEHKDRYVVKTGLTEYDAELIGNLRYTAESRHDLPAVGDWVGFSEYDLDKALIHSIYPRYSMIERQAIGKAGKKQLIATNIDFGLIVLSVNRDFSLNRLERYLTICNSSKVEPVIILSKIDLVDEFQLQSLRNQIEERIRDVPIVVISNLTHEGMKELTDLISPGRTYCLLGSSGVGKSTIVNELTGRKLMETAAISQKIDRGKHVTSHRELIILENGGILIDNPGMREVGIADTTSGLEITFSTILEYAEDCKFKDCTHTREKGCAILAAVENGEIDEDAYANFRKMEREKSHFEMSERELKRKDKSNGKLYKRIIKQRKQDKF